MPSSAGGATGWAKARRRSETRGHSDVRSGRVVGVFSGASLDDPAGLLEGTGKVHRHVKIRAESDHGDELRNLLTRALDRRRADG
jgi:hypothetical protein